MVSASNVAVEPHEPSAEIGAWNLQRIGGLAALTEAAIYVAGILYFLVVLDYANVTGASQQVELFVANETSLYAMNLLIYVVFGVVLVALVLALHDRLKTGAPTWLAINPVVEGLGGGNEIVGGIWALLVSVAALRAGLLHRALNYFGVVVGLTGILSAVPALGEIGGGIFGLTQIIWFVGLGLILLRTSRREVV
jgi:hypothetical protein